ncbi:MAG: hypothetical protein WBB29_20080 [Geitlerinemataceae cyanobacterium]
MLLYLLFRSCLGAIEIFLSRGHYGGDKTQATGKDLRSFAVVAKISY